MSMTIEIGNKPLSDLSPKNIMDIVLIEAHCPHLDYWNEPELLEFDNKTFGDTIVVDYLSTRKKDLIKSNVFSLFFNHKKLSMHCTNTFIEDRDIKGISSRAGLETIKYLIKEGFDVPLYELTEKK